MMVKIFGRGQIRVNFGAENKIACPKWGRRGGVSGGAAMRALGILLLFGGNPHRNRDAPPQT